MLESVVCKKLVAISEYLKLDAVTLGDQLSGSIQPEEKMRLWG